MEILGSGLIAESLRPYAAEVPDALVFARGVSDSSTVDPAAYARELAHLDDALVRCKAQDRKLVYFSSAGAIHGTHGGRRDESTELLPVTPYGRHNVEAEWRIQRSRARHLIVRLANLVGSPQNESQLVPSLVRQACEGRATLHRHATRDVLDVADAVRLTVALLRDGLDRDIVVVARGRSIAVPTLFADITAILGVQPAVELLDRGEPQQFSIRRLVERLGTTPEQLDTTSLELALRRHVPALAELATAGRR